MSPTLFWNEHWSALLVNHLWQSTLVAALALLLTFALKKNRARVRYWVWMVASAKFLLPFTLLINAGQWLRSLIAVPVVKPNVTSAIELVAQPFQATSSLGVANVSVSAHHSESLPVLLLSIWICGTLIIAMRWTRAWMSIRTVVCEATPTTICTEMPVLSSASLMEPGVFGIFRPVLLLPDGILERLQPEQLHAIVEHEMCHVRRRDNLTFALHMLAQAMFWFHPLTWWIGARLIEERERACDEAVLEAGGQAEVYAEGILNVCKFYVESPLACASGVSGSDLKDRIARIMTAPMTYQLNLTRKLLLGITGFAVIALPLSLGLVRTVLAEVRAEDAAAKLPKFEVASIKPHQSGQTMRIMMRMLPDGINISGLPMERLILMSFGLPGNRILNEPGWVKGSQFDIEVKVDPVDAPKLKGLTMDERWAMMLPVMEERFGLKFHRETRDVEVYTLMLGKAGTKMKEFQNSAADQKGDFGSTMMRFSPNELVLKSRTGATTESIARMISQQIGSTVIDRTGLTGKYEFELHWLPDRNMDAMMPAGAGSSGGEPAPESNAPPLFTAIQEQLGLKLVSQKEPVEVIVIDQIQQPSPN